MLNRKKNQASNSIDSDNLADNQIIEPLTTTQSELQGEDLTTNNITT